ncbi:uncharacterized protein LOC127847266 isoform X3 [Dreissena polymorpha]|uniref:uncharacterized protein LOC127847266 isoform X3 n=1 Tax=Dreissena polymorpha TaxID=45954 RepID=UPI002264C1D4|nr:uncharacterized protein LOC127847266 isoform X3 [Dreissena polymorpha]
MNEIVKDSGLKNWIKACLGLRYVRDGICPFMEKNCNDLYLSNETYTKRFCQLTTFSCANCSIKTLRPSHSGNQCPTKGKSVKIKCGCQSSANTQICLNNGLCGVLYDQILNQHVNKMPRWDNSECSKWYKNGWEQMKCFINIPGYNGKEHISQADITAFVHICQNNIKLKNMLRTEIDKLIQVRTDRNEIFHSGDMAITDDKLKEYISNMRDVLQISIFNKLPDIQTFLDKLTKLETDINEINTTQEMIARKDALNALVEAHKLLQEETTNSSKDKTQVNHQLALLEVLQDDHMKFITGHLQELKQHMQSVKEEYNRSARVLLQHSNELKTITSAISQHTTCFENLKQELVEQTTIIRGIETITMGIERIVTNSYRMISEIKPEIQTMLLIVEKLYQSSQDTANIPGKIIAEINGISHKADLTHQLVQRLQDILTKPELEVSDEIGRCLSAAKSELEKEGVTVNDIQDGSVEILFQCSSIPKWIKICEKCIDGRIAKIFGPLQDRLRSRQGCENLQITVDMYETDFVGSVEAILKQLRPHLISKLPHFAESERYSDLTKIKWDEVLRLLLKHEQSREPSFPITVAGKVEDSYAVSEKIDVLDTELSRLVYDATDVYDSHKDEGTQELQYATADIKSYVLDDMVKVSGNDEETEELQSVISNLQDVIVSVSDNDYSTKELQTATCESNSYSRDFFVTVTNKGEHTEELPSATAEVMDYLRDGSVKVSDGDDDTAELQSATDQVTSISRHASFTLTDNIDTAVEMQSASFETTNNWHNESVTLSDKDEDKEEHQTATNQIATNSRDASLTLYDTNDYSVELYNGSAKNSVNDKDKEQLKSLIAIINRNVWDSSVTVSDEDEDAEDLQCSTGEHISNLLVASLTVSDKNDNKEKPESVTNEIISKSSDIFVSVSYKDEDTDGLYSPIAQLISNSQSMSCIFSDTEGDTELMNSATADILNNSRVMPVVISDKDEETKKLQSVTANISSNPLSLSFTFPDKNEDKDELQSANANIIVSDKDEDTKELQYVTAKFLSPLRDIRIDVPVSVQRFQATSNPIGHDSHVSYKDEDTDGLYSPTAQMISYSQSTSSIFSDKQVYTGNLQSATADILNISRIMPVVISDNDEDKEELQSANADIIGAGTCDKPYSLSESLQFSDIETSIQSKNETSHSKRVVGQEDVESSITELIEQVNKRPSNKTLFSILKETETLREQNNAELNKCKQELKNSQNKDEELTRLLTTNTETINRLNVEIKEIEQEIDRLLNEAVLFDEQAIELFKNADRKSTIGWGAVGLGLGLTGLNPFTAATVAGVATGLGSVGATTALVSANDARKAAEEKRSTAQKKCSKVDSKLEEMRKCQTTIDAGVANKKALHKKIQTIQEELGHLENLHCSLDAIEIIVGSQINFSTVIKQRLQRTYDTITTTTNTQQHLLLYIIILFILLILLTL